MVQILNAPQNKRNSNIVIYFELCVGYGLGDAGSSLKSAKSSERAILGGKVIVQVVHYGLLF